MTPELLFDFIPIVTQNPEDLNQFDGTDALDTYSHIRLGLRNRLQTKLGKPGEETSVDIVNFDTRINLFPGNAGLNRKRDNFIEWDLKLRLSDRLSFASEGNELNLSERDRDRDDVSSWQRLDVLNTSLSYNHPKWGNYTIGNRYSKNVISTINYSFTKKVNEKWRVGLSQQLSMPTSTTQNPRLIDRIRATRENLNANASLQRYFHDWIVNISIIKIGFRQDDETDNIFMFNIIPRGIAKVRTQARSLKQLGAMIPGSAAREEQQAQIRK